MPSTVDAMTIRLSPEHQTKVNELAVALAPPGARALSRNDVVRVLIERSHAEMVAQKNPKKPRIGT